VVVRPVVRQKVGRANGGCRLRIARRVSWRRFGISRLETEAAHLPLRASVRRPKAQRHAHGASASAGKGSEGQLGAAGEERARGSSQESRLKKGDGQRTGREADGQPRILTTGPRNGPLATSILTFLGRTPRAAGRGMWPARQPVHEAYIATVNAAKAHAHSASCRPTHISRRLQQPDRLVSSGVHP